MKRIIFLLVFTFLAISLFGQIPSVVVSDFTSRARDVHEEDLVTVMEMFMNTLATGKTVNVIDRNVLERVMKTQGFNSNDWSDSTKTTRIGEELNAIYIVSGTMTQLGTSLTFSISVRDIKTLEVITSDQRQYTLENVWDNSVGIPAQLSNMGNSISSGINTENNKRLQVIQEQLAQEERARLAQLAREEEQQALIGTWQSGEITRPPQPPRGSYSYSYSDGKTRDYVRLIFRENGTFTATRLVAMTFPSGDYTGRNEFEQNEYSGTYVRDGNNLRLTWTLNTYWERVVTDSRRDTRTDGNRSSSGNSTYTVSFGRNNNGNIVSLSLNGGSPFGRGYSK